MKTFFKIIALAMIAAAAAISCAPPPDLDISGYDWNTVYTYNKPENNNGANVTLPTLDSGYAEAKNPQVTITFPARADILTVTPEKIEDSLKEFLSFHTFTDPAVNPTATDKGEARELSADISYKYVKQNGQDITVELTKDFTLAAQPPYSKLIAKFKVQKYTYSKGIKMDVDGNGIAGEEVYDDLYREKNLTGAQAWTWVGPGHKGWYLSLATVPGGTFTGNAAETDEQAYRTAATLNLPGIGTVTAEGKAVYKAVGEQLASGFKLQKFDNATSKWADVVGVTAVYDDTQPSYVSSVVFKNVKFEHRVLYRIKWSGSANLVTNASYFGVKQRLYISGSTPTSSSNKRRYSWTEVFSATQLITNSSLSPTTYIEISTNPTVQVFQLNDQGGKVTLKVKFPLQSTGIALNPYVGLDPTSMSEADFKSGKGFQIVYRKNNTTNNNLFLSATDLIHVGISSVSYEGEAEGSVNEDKVLKNVIYITLDPSYKYISGESSNLYFLINNTLKYTGTAPVRAFGDRTRITYDYYRLYTPSFI